MPLSRKTKWTLASSAAAMATAFVTKEILKYGWNAATGEDPPLNPADTSTAWTEAAVWAAAAGVVAGLSRVAARRTMAQALDGPVPDDQYAA